MHKTVDISVVVCTYNRAGMLERALKSLAVQHLSNQIEYEVIVVDDASTDNTAEVVREAKRCTDRSVIYIRESGRGISAARNAGLKAAAGAWIAFTDDDQIADSGWLANLWFAQQQTGALCVGGARTLELRDEVLRSLPLYTRLILGEIPPVRGVQPCGRNALLCTGNLLVRRDAVEDAGGFDESLTQGGEDTDLIMRLRRAGHACWFTHHAVVRHMIPAYRLEPGYLLWSAQRGGDCFALRDVRERGVFWSVGVAVARATQALGLFTPAMTYARLRGNDALAIAYKCRIARALAYGRRVLALLVSNDRTESESNSPVTFRAERALFDRTAG